MLGKQKGCPYELIPELSQASISWPYPCPDGGFASGLSQAPTANMIPIPFHQAGQINCSLVLDILEEIDDEFPALARVELRRIKEPRHLGCAERDASQGDMEQSAGISPVLGSW